MDIPMYEVIGKVEHFALLSFMRFCKLEFPTYVHLYLR